jgi:5-methylcytosine-specific restriction protein A
MPKKPCVDCKRLIPLGVVRCAPCASKKQRRYDRQRGSAAARGYGADWKRIRAAYLAEHPICAEEGCKRLAEHVHHIRRLRNGGTHHSSNLLQLCAHHHNQISSREDGGFGNMRRERGNVLD